MIWRLLPAVTAIGVVAGSWISREPTKPMGIVSVSAASMLSTEVVHAVLNDENTVDLAVGLLAAVFKHREVLDATSTFFVNEFTENDETVANLKRFIVDKVLVDPWVYDELIHMSHHLGVTLTSDAEIWPGLSLELLKNSSLEALQSNEFNDNLKEAVRSSLLVTH